MSEDQAGETVVRADPQPLPPLVVLRAKTKSVLGIDFVDVRLDGSMVVVTGENGAGKTSFIDSILMTLGGAKHTAEQALKMGARQGQCEVELGPMGGPTMFTATVRVTASGRTLTLVDDAGVVASAQTFLNALRGPLSFDPESILDMSDAELSKTLLDLAGLSFTEADAERATLYAQRTEVGRQGKKAAGDLSAELSAGLLPDIPDEIDTAPLVEELTSRKDAITQATAAKDALVQGRRDCVQAEEGLAQEEADLKQAQNRLDEMAARVRKARETMAVAEVNYGSLNEEVLKFNSDALVSATTTAENALREAESSNHSRIALLARRDKINTLTATSNDTTTRFEEMTDELGELDRAKATVLADAEFPVDGLTIDDEGNVSFQGLPLSQAPESSRLSIAVSIVMAQNPTLRVGFIRRGSGLGPLQMRVMQAAVETNGGQLFVEKLHVDAEDADFEVLKIVEGRIEDAAV